MEVRAKLLGRRARFHSRPRDRSLSPLSQPPGDLHYISLPEPPLTSSRIFSHPFRIQNHIASQCPAAPDPPLHPSVSSQSDIDEIDSLIVHSHATVLPASAADVPVNSPRASPTPPRPDSLLRYRCWIRVQTRPARPALPLTGSGPCATRCGARLGYGEEGPGRIVSILKLVVFPNLNREDPWKALRDWDLWAHSSSSCFLASFFLGRRPPKSCRCYHSDTKCTASGWAHNLLPEPQSFRILHVPFRCWCSYLHAER